MIKALVFDFDGLILETEQPVMVSWQTLFDKYGLDLPFETWALNIGTSEAPFDPVDALHQHLGPGVDISDALDRRRDHELELIGDQPPMPGVVDYLQDARRLGLKVGLASSSSCAWVEGHLVRLGLREYFDCVRARDDVSITKPDPALFLSAVETLGVQPCEAIAFEDSRNGLIAARSAGLICVAVPNSLTRLTDLSDADLTLESLEEMRLEELIERVEGMSVKKVD